MFRDEFRYAFGGTPIVAPRWWRRPRRYESGSPGDVLEVETIGLEQVACVTDASLGEAVAEG